MKINVKKNKENSKGITLIALAITIIVLLILAGVTIATLTGENGILSKAQNSKTETEKANEKEQIELAVLTSRINDENNAKINKTILKKELEKLRNQGVIVEVKDEGGNIVIGEEIGMSTKKAFNGRMTVATTDDENAFPWIVTGKTKTEYKIDENGNVTEEKTGAKINYVLNGGNFENETTVIYEYKSGEIVRFLSPVKEGYAFDGWYKTSDTTGTSITSTEGLTGDITIYAKWIEETPSDYFEYDGSTIIGFSPTGIDAFSNEKITTLVIPQKNENTEITAIKASAFSVDKVDIVNNKIVINKLILKDNITNLGELAFKNNTDLTDLTISISLSTAPFRSSNAPFIGCSNINTIKFTKGTGIGVDYINQKLQNTEYYQQTPWYISSNAGTKITVNFEEGITTIGTYMFCDCTNIQNLNLPSTITSVGSYAFNNCTSMKGKLENIANITSIGSYAFNGCKEIYGELIIPEQIKTVEVNTFAGTSINKLKIHDNVTKLGELAFTNCTNLTDLTMPISLSAAPFRSTEAPFIGCTNINTIKFTKGNGIGIDYKGTHNSNENYYQKTPWYISSNAGTKITVNFEEGITAIGTYMFCDCKNIQNLNLPSTITSVGSYAFNNCTSMKGKLENIENITSIGSYAFNGCKEIYGELIIPEQIKTVGVNTFAGTSINKLKIHDNVTKLGELAFTNCTNLTELTMPISLSAAPFRSSNAPFIGCSNINTIKFTKGNGIGIDYKGTHNSNENYYQQTPWYYSKDNNLNIILEKGITSIGTYTFLDLGNATFYYTGSEAEWANVSIGANNVKINIAQYNYNE